VGPRTALFAGAAALALSFAAWRALPDSPAPTVERPDSAAVAPPPESPALAAAEAGAPSAGRPRGTGSVSVRVIRHDDRAPLPGASVWIAAAGRATPTGAIVRTDDAGVALFDDVPADRGYRVRVDAGDGNVVEQADVVVVARRRTDVGPIAVGLPTVLEGTVVDEMGDPIAGATVRLHRSEETGFLGSLPFVETPWRVSLLASATTDASGRFEATGLAAGSVRVEASAPERGSADVATSVEAGRRRIARPVVLWPATSVEGRVVDEHGRPVAGATIVGKGIEGATTGPEGAFRVRLSVLEPIRLCVRAAGFAPWLAEWDPSPVSSDWGRAKAAR
jgi:protocatechuate 3,4-dioxygenase beta subunit